MLDLFYKGDDRCPIKIGDTVEKVWSNNGKELHKLGDKGKVVGSIFHEEIGAMYLVEFPNDPAPTFIIGAKINKVKES